MAAKRGTPVESVEPPTVAPTEGAALLRERISKAQALATVPVSYDEMRKWKIGTEQALADALGRNHPMMKDVVRAGSELILGWADDQEAFRLRREIVLRMSGALEPCIEYLEREAARQPLTPDATPLRVDSLARVQRVLERFTRVARLLRDRYDNRETLKVDDEYDVQDLLRALLSVDFSDVRKEEGTPSHAGKSARMDLLLKEEKIVIEAKITKPGRSEKQIGDELLVDIGRYVAHPDCKTLVCFVYDPTGQIGNPAALEHDLSREGQGLRVVAVVWPKH